MMRMPGTLAMIFFGLLCISRIEPLRHRGLDPDLTFWGTVLYAVLAGMAFLTAGIIWRMYRLPKEAAMTTPKLRSLPTPRHRR